MKSPVNTTHVEYVKLLPAHSEPLKLRGLAKVPFEPGCKHEGWA